MDFFEAVERRRSVRTFAPRPVEEGMLHKILETANQAPSAGNLQAFEIYVVRQPAVMADLASAALGQDFLARAPLALVFCAHPDRSASRYGKRGADLYALQDATISCTFAMLAAAALGLASVWIGAFDDRRVQRVLGLDAKILPLAILAIGHDAEKPLRTPRRKLNEIVHPVG